MRHRAPGPGWLRGRHRPASATRDGASRLIAVTAYNTDADRRRSQEVGFERHLVKPVDPDALFALLAAR